MRNEIEFYSGFGRICYVAIEHDRITKITYTVLYSAESSAYQYHCDLKYA